MKKEAPLQSKSVAQEPERVFAGQEKIASDLFKLEVAMVKKNISYSKIAQFESVEHAHFYNTFDSSGRKLVYSSPTAGHSHRIEQYTDAEGKLQAKCGPAVRIIGNTEYPYYAALKTLVRDSKTGRMIETNIEDNHTHDVSYIRSMMVEPRKYSEKAASAMQEKMNYERSSEATISGVRE